MFSLFFRKKDKISSKLYPTFSRRIFAVILDLALLSIVAVPATHLVSRLVFNGNPPSQELRTINHHASRDAKTIKMWAENVNTDPDYIAFKEEGRLYLAVAEQFIQMMILSVIILAFWMKTQSSPGKMLLSMKIVDADDFSKKPSVFQFITRWFGYILSMLPFGLGLFYINLNKKRRAWHDLFSNTIVISEKEYLENVKSGK